MNAQEVKEELPFSLTMTLINAETNLLRYFVGEWFLFLMRTLRLPMVAVEYYCMPLKIKMEAASRTGTSIHFENEVPRIGSVNKMAQCQCILKDGIPQPQLDFS